MKYSLPSDLWSAGVMAYQLVTGRLPFSGEDGEEVSTLYMQTQRFEHKVRPQAPERNNFLVFLHNCANKPACCC